MDDDASRLVHREQLVLSPPSRRADARDLAAKSGFVVLARDPQNDLTVTRNVATIAGMLLALAILAMTVGLIRSEAARDLQTLTATGATSITRRTLTAVTAAALALLGALLGLVGADVVVGAVYHDDLWLPQARAGPFTSHSQSSAYHWPPPQLDGCSPAVSRPRSPGQ